MQYHSYIFFSSEGRHSDLPKEKINEYKRGFMEEIKSCKDVVSTPFATLGLKANTDLMFWFQAEKLEPIQDLLNRLLHTRLGKYLKITYSFFGMSRPTQYSPDSKGYLETSYQGKKYFIIYPFVKNKEWYKLSFEERKKLMWGHVQIGKKHPEIEQILLYSFGVDDSEFIVSYETDNLADFQTLVMELRLDKVRMFTQSDTPIFTCIYKPLDKVLDYI